MHTPRLPLRPPFARADAAPVPALPRAHPTRRTWLLGSAAALALPGMSGCGSNPLPLGPAPGGTADGQARLLASAQAHGLAAYRQLQDINIAYGGQWRPFIGRIQPEVVDERFRGPSEERLMPARGVNAQRYRGPAGEKFVFWQRGRGTAQEPGRVAVWYNGQPSTSPRVLSASALVAEGYGLFLLGPLWLAERGLPAVRDGTATVDGRSCDVVQVWMRPGLGQVPEDRVTLFIDQRDDTTRRVRFTLEGFDGTRGAVAETDTFDHQRRHGVLWPMRSFERVVHPLRLPAHDWFISGLDVNRGYALEALAGPTFTGAAAAPATPV